MRPLDGLSKLQHLLQTMAFCLAIATVQYAFQPSGTPIKRKSSCLCAMFKSTNARMPMDCNQRVIHRLRNICHNATAFGMSVYTLKFGSTIA